MQTYFIRHAGALSLAKTMLSLIAGGLLRQLARVWPH